MNENTTWRKTSQIRPVPDSSVWCRETISSPYRLIMYKAKVSDPAGTIEHPYYYDSFEDENGYPAEDPMYWCYEDDLNEKPDTLINPLKEQCTLNYFIKWLDHTPELAWGICAPNLLSVMRVIDAHLDYIPKYFIEEKVQDTFILKCTDGDPATCSTMPLSSKLRCILTGKITDYESLASSGIQYQGWESISSIYGRLQQYLQINNSKTPNNNEYSKEREVHRPHQAEEGRGSTAGGPAIQEQTEPSPITGGQIVHGEGVSGLEKTTSVTKGNISFGF